MLVIRGNILNQISLVNISYKTFNKRIHNYITIILIKFPTPYKVEKYQPYHIIAI